MPSSPSLGSQAAPGNRIKEEGRLEATPVQGRVHRRVSASSPGHPYTDGLAMSGVQVGQT